MWQVDEFDRLEWCRITKYAWVQKSLWKVIWRSNMKIRRLPLDFEFEVEVPRRGVPLFPTSLQKRPYATRVFGFPPEFHSQNSLWLLDLTPQNIADNRRRVKSGVLNFE